MKFKVWLENKEIFDDIKFAILGSLPEEISKSTNEENVLQMNIQDFGDEILEKIKNLGVVTNLKMDDPVRWQNIVNSIKNGISIKDLINKIAGLEAAPNVSF